MIFMANVFTGKVAIPGDKIEEYFALMEAAEKAREPFVQYMNNFNKEFASYLDQCGFADKTIAKHTTIIDLFIDFLARYTDVEKIEDITKGMANTHFTKWYKRKVLDSRTADEIRVALTKFFTFLAEQKKISNINILSKLEKKAPKEQQQGVVLSLIFEKDKFLHFTEEDKALLKKLSTAYVRKRTGIVVSKPEITAAALLWLYSKTNFLWENDEIWKQQNIAQLFILKQKTIGNKTSEIAKALKIDVFDLRFCRKEVSDQNPLNNFVMLPSGFIVSKDMLDSLR